MPQAETFLVKVTTPQGGVVVGDVVLKSVDGGILPSIIHTGYVYNLEQVDIPSFAYSARRGMLLAMEESGSVVRIIAEVGEKTFDALRAELEKYPKLRKDGPYAHATQVITLEPGMMVATGGAGIGPAGLVAPPPTPEISVPAAKVQAEDLGQQTGAQPQVAPAAVGVSEAQAENTVASWKSGKTLPEQEAIVKASKDKVFLKSVVDDKEETKKMQRLAKARLAELE